MKRKIIKAVILSSLVLVGCGNRNKVSENNTALLEVSESSYVTSTNSLENQSVSNSSVIIISNQSESSLESSYISSSNINNVSSSLSSSASSISSSKGTTSIDIGGIGSLPNNINNPTTLGKSNKEASVFTFNNEMPDNFRYIYGNNFTKGEFYANGELKMKGNSKARKGFQTCAFSGDKKLEIRIGVGQMNNSSGQNNIKKNEPILYINGYSNEGNLIRTVEVNDDIFASNNKGNFELHTYMDGNNISYLEIILHQLPYKSSQTYNFGIKSLSLIAWPYEMK